MRQLAATWLLIGVVALCAKVTSAQEESLGLGAQAGADALTLGQSEEGTPREIPDANTFGVASSNFDWVSMEDFEPFDPAAGFSRNLSDFYWTRSGTAGAEYLAAYLRLDSGAQVSGIRFFYRDTNSTLDPTFFLCVHTVNDSSGTLIGNDCNTNITPTTNPNPGSVLLTVPTSLNPYRRTNAGDEVRWILVARIPAGDGTIQFGGARAVWTRIVSPAPATATFGDVPLSNGQNQFVEALVAAGITAGCGGGNYCPDTAVTRGQMAVFLARALGLHFSP